MDGRKLPQLAERMKVARRRWNQTIDPSERVCYPFANGQTCILDNDFPCNFVGLRFPCPCDQAAPRRACLVTGSAFPAREKGRGSRRSKSAVSLYQRKPVTRARRV